MEQILQETHAGNTSRSNQDGFQKVKFVLSPKVLVLTVTSLSEISEDALQFYQGQHLYFLHPPSAMVVLPQSLRDDVTTVVVVWNLSAAPFVSTSTCTAPAVHWDTAYGFMQSNHRPRADDFESKHLVPSTCGSSCQGRHRG